MTARVRQRRFGARVADLQSAQACPQKQQEGHSIHSSISSAHSRAQPRRWQQCTETDTRIGAWRRYRGAPADVPAMDDGLDVIGFADVWSAEQGFRHCTKSGPSDRYCSPLAI